MYRSQKWGLSSRKRATLKCFKAHTLLVVRSSHVCFIIYKCRENTPNSGKKLQMLQPEQAETGVSNHPPKMQNLHKPTLCVWLSWVQEAPAVPPSPGAAASAPSTPLCWAVSPGHCWSSAGTQLCHTQGTMQPPRAFTLHWCSPSTLGVAFLLFWVVQTGLSQAQQTDTLGRGAASNRELQVINISLIFPDQQGKGGAAKENWLCSFENSFPWVIPNLKRSDLFGAFSLKFHLKELQRLLTIGPIDS